MPGTNLVDGLGRQRLSLESSLFSCIAVAVPSDKTRFSPCFLSFPEHAGLCSSAPLQGHGAVFGGGYMSQNALLQSRWLSIGSLLPANEEAEEDAE